VNVVPTDVEVINVSRRSLRGAIRAAGLVLAVSFPPPASAADSMPSAWIEDPLVSVAIGADGTVTITCHRRALGRDLRSSVPMVVADELEADWTRVRVLQSLGDEARGADATRGMRHFSEAIHRCGAAARKMLEQAAAAQWKVPLAEVTASHHEVVHRPTNRRLGYGLLSIAASVLPVPNRERN
jgi:isoquinoline 1-oxidoreductase beta subunit